MDEWGVCWGLEEPCMINILSIIHFHGLGESTIARVETKLLFFTAFCIKKNSLELKFINIFLCVKICNSELNEV